MAMDFPASPTEGQTYQAPGGPLYTYRAPAWRSGVTVPQIAKAQRNRLVNGAMQISQENGSTPVTTAGGYPADQWAVQWAGLTNISSTRNPLVTPNGSAYSLLVSCSTAKPALAVTDFYGVTQSIEGTRVVDFQWGTADAKRAILRFWVWSQVAGTFSVVVRGVSLPTPARTFAANYTIAAADIGKLVERVILVPGDTTGAWVKDNNVGVLLTFTFATGTTYVAPAAGWNAGNYLAAPGVSNGAAAVGSFFVADVGLYLDEDGSGVPPRWEMPDEAQELAACMRYYYKQPFSLMGYGVGTLTGQQLFHPAPMRAAPAMALVGGTYANASSCNLVPADWLGVRAYITVTAAGTGYFDSAVAVANARM